MKTADELGRLDATLAGIEHQLTADEVTECVRLGLAPGEYLALRAAILRRWARSPRLDDLLIEYRERT